MAQSALDTASCEGRINRVFSTFPLSILLRYGNREPCQILLKSPNCARHLPRQRRAQMHNPGVLYPCCTRAVTAETELAQVRATVSCSEAMIKELNLEIAKLRRDKYGVSTERSARLLDQLEL